MPVYQKSELLLTNPHGLEVRNRPIAGNMPPPHRLVFVPGLAPTPKQLAQLLPNLNLRNSANGTRLQRHIIRVINHGHKIPQHRRHGQISAHVRLVPRRPKRNRVLSQHPRRLLHRLGHLGCHALELGRDLDGLGDEVVAILDVLLKVLLARKLELVEQCGDVFAEFGEVLSAGANEVGADGLVGDVLARGQGLGFPISGYKVISNWNDIQLF